MDCYLRGSRDWFLVLTPHCYRDFPVALRLLLGLRFSFDLIRFIIVNKIVCYKIDLQLVLVFKYLILLIHFYFIRYFVLFIDWRAIE